VRATDFVNAYASGISVGASWNKNLAYQRGRSMGGEFRTKGANVALGPVVGPLGRIVEGGRNWEGFATDPYLCGSLAFETVLGIQEMGVITSTKVCYPGKLCHYYHTKGCSTSLVTSKRPTGGLGRMPKARTYNRYPRTSMTRHYTSSTCGHSKMPSMLVRGTLCAHTKESTTLTAVLTVSY
jgi:hypothetical protein